MAPSACGTLSETYESLSLTHASCLDEKHDFAVKTAYVGENEVNTARELVGGAFKQRVESIDSDTCEVGDEDAFYVADLGEVYRQHLRWKRLLPRVKPHYAVKCNPDAKVLRLLAALGAGFDCASKVEMEQILNLGVDQSRIIYAQPCKTKSHLRYAATHGIKQMTFDNADELYKAKQLFPDAELYIRIMTDDSASMCRLSLKFGAGLDVTDDLLRLAKELELNVVGVAFHAGSGASDPNAFVKAVQDARFVFDQAAEIGFDFHALDVGGGFVSETFDIMAAALSTALDAYFPSSIRIIGEPGRYYVSAAFTIACHVIARRTVVDPMTGTPSYMLYLNDGVYGNFSSIMFDHQQPVPQVLRCGNRFTTSFAQKRYGETRKDSAVDGMPVRYSVWGPTCDSIDIIAQQWEAAQVVDVGDWLFFENMGAYTKCSATRFNGFTDAHEVVYVCSEPGAQALLED